MPLLQVCKCGVEWNIHGPGKRYVIGLSGCTHRCSNCPYPEYWPILSGTAYTGDTLLAMIREAQVYGLSITGGEPLLQGRNLLMFLKKFRNEFPKQAIWLYSAYSLKELRDICKRDRVMHKIIAKCTAVILGKYDKTKASRYMAYRMSGNQLIYKVSVKDNILVFKDVTELVDRVFAAHQST